MRYFRSDTCLSCHGTGRIIWTVSSSVTARVCPWCLGTGAIDDNPKE